jgi:hypothetical protein
MEIIKICILQFSPVSSLIRLSYVQIFFSVPLSQNFHIGKN